MLKTLNSIILFFFIFHFVHAQTEYKMSNNYVVECEGILTDSEAGDDPSVENGYDHNENFVFTVCVPNSDGFTVTFTEFFLEPNYDSLTIYAGPNTNSPLIGSYKGITSPGVIDVPGDCITFHFVSDASISAPGFRLTWEAIPPDPIPPVFNSNDNVTCESTEVTLTMDVPIPCSEVLKENFQFNGPSGGGIASVSPVNCSENETQQIKVVFNSPLDESGRYWITFTVTYVDVCGNIFTFDVSTYFDIIDCPLEIDLKGSLNVCEGSCVTLFADASGGNPSTYVFNWHDGSTSTSPYRVFCPVNDTLIYCTVSDDSPSPSATDSIYLTIIPSPSASTPKDSLCKNDADITLTATPTGGTWSGAGIIDNVNGVFRPNQAALGNNIVVYQAPNGCTDTLSIFIHQIHPGPPEIACLNSPMFMVRGGTPTGGTWSGSPNIDLSGNYTPGAIAFVDTITYTAPNGCSAKKLVHIVDSVIVQNPDTVCINDAPFNLTFEPFGGDWSVSYSPNGTNGITNKRQGTFNPTIAGEGTHIVRYDVFGCYDSTSIHVINIEAGNNDVFCPEQDTLTITSGIPIGGIWKGLGVTDTSAGKFYPGINNGADFNTTLTYSLQGCVDSKNVWVVQTAIDTDTISFCDYDDPTSINALGVNILPGNGNWTGVGISNPDNIDPGQYDSSFTYIYYQANTCTDSMVVEIYPTVKAQKDTIVCPASPDFNLSAIPANGVWSGYGIIDHVNGTFSPDSTGPGEYFVLYTVNGCTDQVKVTINDIPLEISNYKSIYCYNSTPVFFDVVPLGGTWSGPGITNQNTGEFTSAVAGQGTHIIKYTYGSGECAMDDSIEVSVRLPITATIEGDTSNLCYGEVRPFHVAPNGGYNILGYEFLWEPYGQTDQFIQVMGTEDVTLTVHVFDNCSDTAVISIPLEVYPEIIAIPESFPKVCYGDSTQGNIITDSSYVISWNTNPPRTTAFVDSILHGRYQVTVTDTSIQCSTMVDIHLPSYPYLNAYFDYTPKNCITYPDTTIYFIDMSTGAEVGNGMWYFQNYENNDSLFYNPNINPTIHYSDSGKYAVELTINNGGGKCVRSYSDTICVKPYQQFHMPNSFTPNGDGYNDHFPLVQLSNGKWVPVGEGITDYEMRIYDRWGELIHDCNGESEPWNGGIKNDLSNPAESGVYSYYLKVMYQKPLNEIFIGKVVLLR